MLLFGPTKGCATIASMSVGVDHYENFPVASWLCPKRLRPAVQAIYHWARTGDDIADEGSDTPAQRLSKLRNMRQGLHQAINGQAHDERTREWTHLAAPLATLVARGLQPKPLFDLLLAFELDIRHTANAVLGERYQDWPALLDYCRHSANPVGRLMLQLYEVTDPRVVAMSDAVCTGLQLVNFWQDLSQDLDRQRFYIPATVLAQHQLPPTCDLRQIAKPKARAVVKQLVGHAKQTMNSGMNVVHAVPGRAGWELAMIVAGGLRILQLIERSGYDSAHTRIKLSRTDWFAVAWHAVRIKLHLA